MRPEKWQGNRKMIILSMLFLLTAWGVWLSKDAPENIAGIIGAFGLSAVPIIAAMQHNKTIKGGEDAKYPLGS